MSSDKKGPPMTQTSKLGITPGECFLTGRNDHTEISGFMVIGIHREDNSIFATAYVAHIDDACLYADAHNVANRTGLTPSELEKERDEYKRQRDELLDLLSDAWRDIFQTARANQTNLTGVDIITPEDEPIPELIGKRHVHQAGIDESLRLVERIKSAITSATKDKP